MTQMLTGRDLTEAAALMRAKREKVIETEKIELDRDEVISLRRDIASVLENIALEFQGELHGEISKMKDEFKAILLKLNEAAEAELRRHK